jgi:hypothetical protein
MAGACAYGAYRSKSPEGTADMDNTIVSYSVELDNDELCMIRSALIQARKKEESAVERGDKVGIKLARLRLLLCKLPYPV